MVGENIEKMEFEISRIRWFGLGGEEGGEEGRIKTVERTDLHRVINDGI